MPRVQLLNGKRPPEGWSEILPQLEEFKSRMRDAVNEPHEGKRRNEANWPIQKIHYERSRYIYELYYKTKAISKELYEYLLKEKWADANLIAKWKKPGFEYLCSLAAIDKSRTHFGTTSICRVPLHLRKPGPQGPNSATGCISCASSEASRMGGPIWWDTPRPADLVGWAKAGCPTADKPGRKRKGRDDDEVADAELEKRLKVLRGESGADASKLAEMEAAQAALRGMMGGEGAAERAMAGNADAGNAGDLLGAESGFEPPGGAGQPAEQAASGVTGLASGDEAAPLETAVENSQAEGAAASEKVAENVLDPKASS